MLYRSTRGGAAVMRAGEAILKGIADDGGLYVPEQFPRLEMDLAQLVKLSYKDMAYEVLKLYLTDFTEAELKACISGAYDDKFDTAGVAPLVHNDSGFFLELFHGRTIAFKDVALSILPRFLTVAMKKYDVGKKITVLTATSGDTGKAALEGFRDVEGVSVVVFFPEDGVSLVQKRQMTTQEGRNTHVIGVRGNFDDTQTGVKKMFTDATLNKELSDRGFMFSSANSINIGRLLPQIVYYFYAYAQMVSGGYIKTGEPLNFTVPTGNFGNILAGYYAKNMGLPINKLVCASNDNKVLFDFFKTKVYDKNREFKLTSSPSMDILISSNLERLLYHVSNDGDKVRAFMSDLSGSGRYGFDYATPDFEAAYATEDEAADAIKEVYANGYVMDTHTAVGYAAYKKYAAATGDGTKNIFLATASPFKFARAVCTAIDAKYGNEDELQLIEKLSELSGVPVPKQIAGLMNKPILHTTVCDTDKMEAEVRSRFAE